MTRARNSAPATIFNHSLVNESWLYPGLVPGVSCYSDHDPDPDHDHDHDPDRDHDRDHDHDPDPDRDHDRDPNR